MTGEPDLARHLIDASPDAVVVVDTDGRIVFANPAVTALFGYGVDELVGESMEILVPETLRAAHAAHRHRFGGHPVRRPMGAGLRLSGRRRDGSEFPIDVGLAPVTLPEGDVFAAFVRDATSAIRTQQRLRAANELSSAVLAGGSRDGLMQAVARQSRMLLDADVAVVGQVRPDAGDRLLIAAVDARDPRFVAPLPVGATLRFGRGVGSLGQGPLYVADLGDVAGAALLDGAALGPAILVSMPSVEASPSTLLVARGRGLQDFGPDDAGVLADFAAAAAIALRLGQTRSELEQLRLVGEYGRIARDLHDTVIQRLFATGMGLQSILLLLDDPARQRVADAVEELDATIAEIRTTIFGLQHASADPGALRSRVLALVGEATVMLGFRPRVAFDGPVDTLVGEEVADHLLALLSEALANVARHAKASNVDVVVSVAGEGVLVSVADDGVGPSGGPSAGNGLRNMAARALALGGRCELLARTPDGARLEWWVPVA